MEEKPLSYNPYARVYAFYNNAPEVKDVPVTALRKDEDAKRLPFKRKGFMKNRH